MSDRGEQWLADIEANKFTVEELEAIVDVLAKCDPLAPIEETALGKLRWHVASAYNEGDE